MSEQEKEITSIRELGTYSMKEPVTKQDAAILQDELKRIGKLLERLLELTERQWG